jgi:REP element-mobilizing transposase RayT
LAYNHRIHHRRSIRLQGYDYTQPGAYFVTIVAHQRLPLFGEIAGGVVQLSACGKIARAEWLKTAVLRRETALDEFIIMPNHFHAIVTIVECGDGFVGAAGRDGAIRPDDNVGTDGIDGTVESPGTGVRAQRRDGAIRLHGNVRADGMDETVGSPGTGVRAQRRCAPTHPPVTNVVPGSIGAIVRAYKSAVTTRINQLRGTPGAPVWQRNYWERIVRNGDELSRIRVYIRDNPMGWDTDDENVGSDGRLPSQTPPHGRGM